MTAGMGNRDEYPDRADALRELSRAIARGTLEVLRGALRVNVSQPADPLKGGDGRSGAKNCDPPHSIEKRCQHCGGVILDLGRAKRRYCDSACREVAQVIETRFKRHLRYAGEREDRDCPVCGKALAETTRGHAKYCSDKCGAKARYDWSKRKHACVCKHCLRTFRAPRSAQKYCGNSCSALALLASGRSRIRPHRASLTAARFDAMWG